MKKAQLYGQIFIYILTIVVISLILLYGYKAIRNFNDRAEQVACLKFRNDFKSSIDGLLGDFGTVKRADLELCNSYTKICFVETFRTINTANPVAEDSSGTPQFPDKIIKDSIFTSTDKNVFLISKTTMDSFYAGNISIVPALINTGVTQSDILCLDVANSRISLRLESKGDHVDLGIWA